MSKLLNVLSGCLGLAMVGLGVYTLFQWSDEDEAKQAKVSEARVKAYTEAMTRTGIYSTLYSEGFNERYADAKTYANACADQAGHAAAAAFEAETQA